jgi:hypothetical protein
MSYLVAVPDLMASAASDLSNLGSALTAAQAAAVGPTTAGRPRPKARSQRLSPHCFPAPPRSFRRPARKRRRFIPAQRLAALLDQAA